MPRRKRTDFEKQACPSMCIGCGAAAAGHFYEAPACCACKNFFRRIVMRGRNYKGCFKGGACAKNRSLHPCRYCRLDRCLNGGMNPLVIHTIQDPEKNPVVEKFLRITDDLERIRKSRSIQFDVTKPSTSSSNGDMPKEINTQTQMCTFSKDTRSTQCKFDKIMLELLALEDAHGRLRKSSYCPQFVAGLTIDEFVLGPSKLGNRFVPMRAQRYEPLSIMLTTVEDVLRHEKFVDFSNFDYSTKKFWAFQDNVYMIEFIKALPVYARLAECSKRTLLASVLACANFATAFYSYTHHSDKTYYPDGGTMSWTDDIASQSPGSMRRNTAIIAVIREVGLDRREYVLLKMILLLNPLLERLAPDDRVLIYHEKEEFAKMLMSYVLARRGVKNGPSMFTKLLSVIDLVTKLTSWQKNQHILILARGLYKYRVPFAES
ncbi:hypothetical protein PMAYCL1PPCAC_21779, partial [Pristionchus mayeri]